MSNPTAAAKLKICKPIAEVFDAVINSNKINQYFVSSASADMVEGTSLKWRWEEFNYEADVTVLAVEINKSISFQWIGGGYKLSNVILTFESNAEGTATLIKAEESGWDFDQKGVETAIQQTEGWTHFLLCMKAYLIHGIDLRSGGVWN